MQSVQAQTMPVEHVIVKDDGSRQPVWGPIQWTFWRGIQAAESEWVYLLADDDWLEPTAIEKLWQAGGDWKYSQVEMLWPDGRRAVIGGNPPSHGNVTQLFARKRDMQLVREHDLAHPMYDWLLMSRWLRRGLCWAYVPEVLLHHQVDH